ncbi:MAG TPA: tetratricopeptide repeat protein [bacterium]|uniref:Tetratricopeptide repeat protein n=1 Tax=candidate division TA06 bacterium ADurb.Bin417 TaxID=1852828 RepID=A0A1V5MHW0_UNCT6|nr:MAG: Tetratricopeptide repeat protein [candidate division TA06 bacterium ADurb.Bin417]HNQ35449.1 tetratricopeptide repeat protein [bacterium]HNS48839.1 tetratricopeptide repeat protein [bacterium]
MGGGFFQGIILAGLLLVMGIQGWYLVSLKLEGEIGWWRFAAVLVSFAPGILVAALSLPGGGGETISSLPWPVNLAALFLPLICLGIFRSLENRYGLRREAEWCLREIGVWKATLLKDPGHVGALVMLGDLYLRLGEREKAAEYYHQALELKPQDPAIQKKIEFLEKKMELVPAFTREDLGVVGKELKRLPLYLLGATGAVLLIILFVFLLSVLPPAAVFVLVVLVPIILLGVWLLRS